ncbi:T9SS type A sorting domain-containing protein [Saccharicrinis aurantiacus]|uniref:T9SS type A sorting domain-containing protein n=1 Tax=Saccharicrinis aurantiacus TaxID=1849719 RepID=UPI002491F20F|nr:MXAN_6640 family putative metalloprotease [Saccharicrinis aurantiacus]
MKSTLTILLLVASILFNYASAQDVELSNRLIERYEKNKNSAQLKSTQQKNNLWLTPLLKEVVLNWDKLSPKAQEVFSVYGEGPSFKEGTEQLYEAGIFTFHYCTDSSIDEENVDPTDEDNNGVPDYVDNMASIFTEDVYSKYHAELDYTVPPNYNVEDGTGTYHIYISSELTGEGVYGYVSASSSTYVGDNPNSIVIEQSSFGSHMVMRCNYSSAGDSNRQDIALRSTAAHEYMHSIQFGIAASMDSWFFEACATWAENLIYPGIDDNLGWLPEVFFKTDVALNFSNGENPDDDTYDNHWYGTWIFIQYLTEQFGNDIVKDIYNTSIDNFTLDAIDKELSTNYSSTLRDVFVKFHVANAVLKSNADFSPYNYSRAGTYFSYLAFYAKHFGYTFNSKAYESGEEFLNFSGQEIRWLSKEDGNDQLMRLSADYFGLVSSESFKVKLKSSSSLDNMQLVLVKIHYGVDPQRIEVVYADEYNEVIVNDYDSWQGFFPLVIRIDEGVETIDPFNYSLVINNDLRSSVKYNENSEIKIAPNPVNNLLNVYGTKTTDVVVSLTSMTGVEVLRSSLMDNSINVSDLSNGMYFLSVFENSQLVSIKKVIISHH